MTDTTITATPPATSGGTPPFTIEQLTTALNTAVGAATKPLLDKISALESGFAEVKASAGKTATPEAIAKLVSDQLTATQAAAQTAQTARQARSDFVAANLKGLPAVYADKLGTDAAKFAEEGAALRASYQADLAAAGIKAPPVSSAAPGTAGAKSVDKLVDTTGLSGMQLIGLGVAQSSAGITVAPATTAAAAGGSAAK